MATRSMIMLEYPNGKVLTAYCHWDGYPSHNGKILLDHYNTQSKVANLLAPGDMSYLRENCNGAEGHSFDNPVEGQTVYYGRDRGENDVEPRTYESLKRCKESELFDYLFRANEKKWYFRSWGRNPWQELTEAHCKE